MLTTDDLARLLIVACVVLALAGCSLREMSRQETIAAVKECTDAGLSAYIQEDAIGRVVSVKCRLVPLAADKGGEHGT